jgi:hypothetical protein
VTDEIEQDAGTKRFKATDIGLAIPPCVQKYSLL